MKKELELLQGVMREHGVAICIVPTNDFHGSEAGSSFRALLVLQEHSSFVRTLPTFGLMVDTFFRLQFS